MPELTRYTVGFAFTEDKKNVALILKNRPKWQAGKLNGIGGHCEDDDQYGKGSPQGHTTQRREFREETGVDIPEDKWQRYATLGGPDYVVDVFRCFDDAVRNVGKDLTDEGIVSLLPVDKALSISHISNLSYLIPLALDVEQEHIPHFQYKPRT